MARTTPSRTRGNGQSALWLVGLGALSMYLGDPQLGRRRRALLRDRWIHFTHRVADGALVTVRDAANRYHGLTAAVSARLHGEARTPDDGVLVERVRSALGRVSSHPHALSVQARDGEVEVGGVALAAESRAILDAARAVPGVRAVASRLETHVSPEHIPSLQGGRHREPRWELMQDNWSPAWRAMAGAAGAGLAVDGVRRGGLSGLALGALGGLLLLRAITNREVLTSRRD